MNTEEEKEYVPSARKIYFIGFFCIFLAVLSVFLAHTLFAPPDPPASISSSQM